MPTQVALVAGAQTALFALLGLSRHWTFHNETFDLAFYTRIAWGLVHADWWEPMVDAHLYGLHLSWVLAPLGALGALGDTATVLIVAQALAFGAATFPIARVGARHLGDAGALAAALAWLLYPNLAHVAGYEVHPGSLAVLPLAWMAWAIEVGHARAMVAAGVATLLCREDLALVTLCAAALYALVHGAEGRRAAALVAGLSAAYGAYFFFVLQPAHAPPTGSLELHFGRWGGSLGGVAVYLLSHPGELAEHLATPSRALYLPKLLAPLALLPLWRARWFLPAAPILAINLISEWPTTTDLDEHYLSPALPFLVVGAIAGAARLRPRLGETATLAALVVPVFCASLIAGGTPLSLDFEAGAHRADPAAEDARAVLEAVGPTRSVQAPYAMLSHLAERSRLHRASSPEANADFLVIDVAHRLRFAGDETLIRTLEEPPVRDWLARTDHALVLARPRYLLLERGRHPREGLGGHAIVGQADPTSGEPLSACLAFGGARVEGETLVLTLVGRGACASDLALRLGQGERPPRVDLLFGGWLSPAHVRRGDRLESRHHLDDALRAAIDAGRLRIGAIRQSGARPEHADPMSIAVTLGHAPAR